MRKRKSPIALVTVLAVVVVSIAGFQYISSRNPNAAMEPPPPAEMEDAKPLGETRSAQSAQQTANSVQAAMNARSKPSADPEAMAGPGGPSSGPLILGPSQGGKPEKPKPNTSSTSAQWYNDESAMSKDKG